MGKADTIAGALLNGKIVDRYAEPGNSMVPIIKSRQPVKLEPIGTHILKVGDIVFCKVHGYHYTHKITAIDHDRYQIGNNHGHINGWTTKDKIYGIVTKVYEA